MHPLNPKPDSRRHSTAFFADQVEMNLSHCIWYQHILQTASAVRSLTWLLQK